MNQRGRKIRKWETKKTQSWNRQARIKHNDELFNQKYLDWRLPDAYVLRALLVCPNFEDQKFEKAMRKNRINHLATPPPLKVFLRPPG